LFLYSKTKNGIVAANGLCTNAFNGYKMISRSLSEFFAQPTGPERIYVSLPA
jgi:hypothetical protein